MPPGRQPGDTPDGLRFVAGCSHALGLSGSKRIRHPRLARDLSLIPSTSKALPKRAAETPRARGVAMEALDVQHHGTCECGTLASSEKRFTKSAIRALYCQGVNCPRTRYWLGRPTGDLAINAKTFGRQRWRTPVGGTTVLQQQPLARELVNSQRGGGTILEPCLISAVERELRTLRKPPASARRSSRAY